MDIRDYNRKAWDRQVDDGNEWTVPVSPERVAKARQGEWSVLLTAVTPVPRDWFPPLAGLDVLGLACGGGQQGPLFAAAGAKVTIFDNSPKQLGQDALVAARESLTITTVEGDMRDLSAFDDASFDLVFNPCSNGFAPEVRPIWREAFRVLRSGGILMTGFTNPAYYIFDPLKAEKGELVVRHRLPYSDVDDLTEEERAVYVERGEPLLYSHTLEDQIGGQLDAGFLLTGFFEDHGPSEALDAYMPPYIATRAVKP